MKYTRDALQKVTAWEVAKFSDSVRKQLVDEIIKVKEDLRTVRGQELLNMQSYLQAIQVILRTGLLPRTSNRLVLKTVEDFTDHLGLVFDKKLRKFTDPKA